MEYKAPKTLILLKKCITPRRYVELLKLTNLSDRGLRVALKKLLNQGLITKNKDGLYILTEEGKRLVEELEAYELAGRLIKLVGADKVKKLLASELTKSETIQNLILVLLNWRDITSIYFSMKNDDNNDIDIFETRIIDLLPLEEKKLFQTLKTILSKLDRNYLRNYIYLFDESERDDILSSICDPFEPIWTGVSIDEVMRKIEERERNINPDLLEPPLRDYVLRLLNIIEERKREIKKFLENKDMKKPSNNRRKKKTHN